MIRIGDRVTVTTHGLWAIPYGSKGVVVDLHDTLQQWYHISFGRLHHSEDFVASLSTREFRVLSPLELLAETVE